MNHATTVIAAVALSGFMVRTYKLSLDEGSPVWQALIFALTAPLLIPTMLAIKLAEWLWD
jgi:hypothetical protein